MPWLWPDSSSRQTLGFHQYFSDPAKKVPYVLMSIQNTLEDTKDFLGKGPKVGPYDRYKWSFLTPLIGVK